MAQLRRALAFLRALFQSTPYLLDTRTGRLHPILGGAEGDDGGDGGDDGDDDAGSGDDDDPDDDEDDDTVDVDADKVEKDDDWKTKARKHENKAKRAEKRAKKAEADLAAARKSGQTDQEKAIEKARDEARAEVEKERRADRLESRSTVLAARGFEIGEGDDAETVKFADPDDALVYIERAIANGDIDQDDIFDDEGKVEDDGLKAELRRILEEKPHLRAGAEKSNGKPKGDPDSRKGSKSQKDLESMTPEDHERRKYGAKK